MWRAAVALVSMVTAALAAESPRLSRLTPATAGAFWQEREAAGAPMIEPVDGDPKSVLVTFLWRGEATSVSVITLDGIQFSNAAYLRRAKMERLAGTDLWFRTYRMPCDLRFSYRFSIDESRTALHPDPLNPKHYASRSGDSSVAELPCAAPQPEMTRRDGIPHGDVIRETLGEHALQIYVPPSNGEPLDLIVIVGGEFSEQFPVPAMLDNLIAAKRIRPAVAVSIGFADMAAYVKASRDDERIATYAATELVPWLRARYRISGDPRRHVIAGASAPGAAALWIAMRHPGVFANVLSQSGAYAVPAPTPPDELLASAHPETEPLARELARRPRLPLRVFLGAGVLDDVAYEGKEPSYAQPTVLVAARHLRDVLEAKGYPLMYREFGGGHEALAWRGTFVDGLVWLLGKN